MFQLLSALKFLCVVIATFTFNGTAILDELRDPSSFAERLYSKKVKMFCVKAFFVSEHFCRIFIICYIHFRFVLHFSDRVAGSKQKDTFQMRLAFLNLISRLIGHYQLIMLNFYPLLQRYINPKQPKVSASFVGCPIMSQAHFVDCALFFQGHAYIGHRCSSIT